MSSTEIKLFPEKIKNLPVRGKRELEETYPVYTGVHEHLQHLEQYAHHTAAFELNQKNHKWQIKNTNT